MQNGPTIPALVLMLAGSIVSSADAVEVSARTNPGRVAGGGRAVVAIRVTDGGEAVAGRPVTIALAEGFECGGLSATSAVTTGEGTVAEVFFTGQQYVEDCAAVIRVTVEEEASAEADGEPVPPATAEATVVVNPQGAAGARIDGISAIALILIVSFAIDRLVRGAFFLLAYWPAWARVFPDPELDAETGAGTGRNRRLAYFVTAGLLGLVALGWFGGVRILAALGFTDVHPGLDIAVTGLILMGGADRTEQLLQTLGASAAPAPAGKPAPIEVTGRLVIDEQGRKSVSVGSDAGPGMREEP